MLQKSLKQKRVTDEEERIMPNEKRRKRIVFVSVFAHNGNISKAESMLRNMGVITLFFLTLSIFWACTITPAATADQVEKMLVAADFKFKTADTPQQMERMQALPQRQFIRHQTDGEEYYLYADVAGCKCVWRGDKAAYSRYKELARERKADYKADLYESQDEELLPDIGWE
jgi:hypothetical protein